MRRLLNICITILILSFFIITPSQTNAVSKSDFVHSQAVQERGNDIYRIYVNDSTPGFGNYTVSTGDNHPATINMGSRQDILYGGAAGDPWSTYLTVRSYTTDTEYTSAASAPIPSPGFTQADLDTYTGSVIVSSNSIVNNWDINNGLDVFTVVQTVAAEGTTLSDSRVRVTTTITNDSESAISLGIRYEWDIMVDGEDGSYIKTINPYSNWYSTEVESGSPTMEQYQATNDPANPIFYINGSINGPVFSPAPTAPSKIQFVSWPSAVIQAFDYTPTGQTIAGPDQDSAITYFWGDRTGDAIILGAGASTSVTQYLFAPMQENTPSVPVLPQTGSE